MGSSLGLLKNTRANKNSDTKFVSGFWEANLKVITNMATLHVVTFAKMFQLWVKILSNTITMMATCIVLASGISAVDISGA